MRPACRRGGVAGRCTAWRRHEPAPLSFSLRGAAARLRRGAGAGRRRGRLERDVPLPGQRLQEHDLGQGGGEARLQADRGRAGHGDPDDASRAPSHGGGAGGQRRLGGARVDPVAQRARDSDARRILEGELRAEEEKLAAMQKEFNNGQPERQGDEKNFQKYLDRVAEMRAAIARKQIDIAALRRELQKLPPPLPQ